MSSERSVVLVERGHHLQHILDVTARVLHGDSNAAQEYAEHQIESHRKKYRMHEVAHSQAENQLAIIKRLSARSWFSALKQTLLSNSIFAKADFHDWEENTPLTPRHLDVQLKYQLAYLCNKINPVFFRALMRPERWFDETSLKVLEEWKTDVSALDELYLSSSELQSMCYEDMRDIIELILMSTSTLPMVGVEHLLQCEVFVPLLGQHELSVLEKKFEQLMQFHTSQMLYWNELCLGQAETEQITAEQVQRELAFSSRIVEALKTDNSWIRIQDKPGQLCFASPEDTACLRHCRREQNSLGDREVLDLLKLFVETYPEFASSIQVDSTGDQVHAVYLLASVCLNSTFRSIFDIYFRYRNV